MAAKDMFEKLGYEYKEYNYGKENKMSNGIQYRKNKKMQEEIERCGIFTEKIIEFYFYHKELELYQICYFSDGSKTECNTFILKSDELKAINKQVEELGWK